MKSVDLPALGGPERTTSAPSRRRRPSREVAAIARSAPAIAAARSSKRIGAARPSASSSVKSSVASTSAEREEVLPDRVDAAPERAGELLGGGARGAVALGGDEIHHRLGAVEADAAIEKRAARELAGAGGRDAESGERVEDAARRNPATVDLELDDRLAVHHHVADTAFMHRQGHDVAVFHQIDI